MSEQGFSVRLSARIDGYLAAMEAAKSATKDLADNGHVNMQRLGGKMQDVGITLSKAVTLPIIAVGGLAVKMSSDFESSFQRMQGLAGVTADEVDGLKKSVLELAGQTAKSPQELADALYEASSAGLNTVQAMNAVEVAARASAVGMGSARDIVGLVASATAAYGSANIDAARATDILTAAIRAGRADPTELAGSLGRVLPIANQLGVSFEEVGGATAYLSNVFGDTNRTVTALQGFLIKLVSPSAQGRKALEEMGTSVAELKAAIDKDGLLGALELLKTHGFQDNAQAMAQLFDDIEGRQGALALMADESGNLATVMGQVRDSAGSLDEAFKGVSDTAGFKMKQAWADVQVALIQAGDVIMPIVSGIAEGIASLAKAFSNLPGPVKTIVVGLLGLAAAAGPVLMVGGSMIKNFNQIKTALTAMSTGAGWAAVALGAVSLAMIAASAIYADNAEKKARLLAITNSFTEALKAEADGQQGAVQAAIAKQLSDKHLIDAAAQYGLKVTDLADIINGKVVPSYEALRKSASDDPGHFNALHDGSQQAASSVIGLSKNLDLMKGALQTAKDEAALAATVNKELGVSTEGVAASMTNAQTSSEGYSYAARDVTKSTDEATAATDAWKAAAQSMTDDITRALDELSGQWDALTGNISDDKSLLNLQGNFDDVKQKAKDAFEAAAKGADDSEQKIRDAHLATDDLKLSVIGYGKEVLGLPPERVTKLLALIDQGQLDLVEEQLALLTRNRDISLNIVAHGGSGSFSIAPNTKSAMGRFVAGGSNVYSSLGEVPGPRGDEVVLPIGDPGALSSMLSDSRASAPISAALLGLHGGSGASPSAPSSPQLRDVTLNNYRQDFTIDEMSKVLAMARLAA